MTEQDKLAALAIKNLDMVFQVIDCLGMADDKFLNALNRRLPPMLFKVFPDWICVHNLPGTFTFRPEKWEIALRGSNTYAYFALEIIVDTRWWLSCFTGVGGGKMGLKFVTQVNMYQGKNSSEITKIFEKFFFANEVALKRAAFEITNEGQIYHPITFSLEKIADSYPNFSDEVFQPFEDALADINTVLPLFEKYVEENSPRKK